MAQKPTSLSVCYSIFFIHYRKSVFFFLIDRNPLVPDTPAYRRQQLNYLRNMKMYLNVFVISATSFYANKNKSIYRYLKTTIVN